MSISDEHELGLMTGMVTSTQNDASPELLVHARRGPCAVPNDEEMCSYLFTRRAPSDRRPNIQQNATAATLSFQRRTHALKAAFMRRHLRTPLGVTTDYWDRTEAQVRQALHSHILYWCKRRKTPFGYIPRVAMPESADRGRAGGQWVRPSSVEHTIADPAAQQARPNLPEDDVYCRTEVARVHAELVRPLPVAGEAHAREVLLWGFLLRAIQTHMYIHACTPVYCLKNRASCRFFFPWPEQPDQHFDESTQRIALQRRHAPDDQFVVPHNLELAAFSPGTVNVLLFDFVRGADQCRSYACKYCGKPEPWYYIGDASDRWCCESSQAVFAISQCWTLHVSQSYHGL